MVTTHFNKTEYDEFLQKTIYTCDNCNESYDDEYNIKIMRANFCPNCGMKIAKNKNTLGGIQHVETN